MPVAQTTIDGESQRERERERWSNHSYRYFVLPNWAILGTPELMYVPKPKDINSVHMPHFISML